MKIVYVSPYFPPSIGGIEIFCKELAIRISQLDHEVHVITLIQDEWVKEHKYNIHIHRLKPSINIFKAKFSLQLRKMIKEINPDIIHIQSPAPITQEYCMINDYKIISTYHGDLNISNSMHYKLLSNLYKAIFFPYFTSKIERIIIPSKAFIQKSKYLKKIPKNKIKVIPNAVDTSFFTPSFKLKSHYRKKIGISAQKIGILVAGLDKYHSYKGVDILIQALANEPNLTSQNIKFVVIGDGYLRSYYEKMAKKMNVSDKILFPGAFFDEELLHYYLASDFLTLPSTAIECSPLVILEAMSCGLPIITSNYPGPSELVYDGITGFRVIPGDYRDLLEKIKTMINMNEDTYSILSHNAREFILKNHSWDNVVKLYCNEYLAMT